VSKKNSHWATLSQAQKNSIPKNELSEYNITPTVTLMFEMALIPSVLEKAGLTPDMFDSNNLDSRAKSYLREVSEKAKSFILEQKDDPLFPLYGNIWTMTDDVRVNVSTSKTGTSMTKMVDTNPDLTFEISNGRDRKKSFNSYRLTPTVLGYSSNFSIKKMIRN
jgi:hypothetical protein